jgi:hypothetical protein
MVQPGSWAFPQSSIAKSEISKSSFCQVILAIFSVLFASQGPEKTLSFILNQLLKVASQQGLASVDLDRRERERMMTATTLSSL